MSANETKLTPWRASQNDPGEEGLPTNGTEMQGDSALSRAMRRDVAQYIEKMAGELSSLARQSNLDLLAYFLDMTRVEARTLIRRSDQSVARGR
jgi:hypothetical protein